MDVRKVYLFLLNLLISVIPCNANCYYSYCYYYYGDYTYWSTARTIGAAVGGGISLIVCIVVVVLLCRFCNRRPAYQGSTFTSAPVSTVTMGTQNYNTAYYPQQPGVQVPYQAPYGYSQPFQQPMNNGGYPNYAYNPPSYDLAANQTKPSEQATAPQQA